MQRLIVTLDGPAGSGKSSVARALAKRLGLAFLDTGAMYRALTAAALSRGLDPAVHQRQVVEMARGRVLDFDFANDPPAPLLDGKNVSRRIRDEDVSAKVSDLAAIPEIRRVMVQAQRQVGHDHPRLVTEGRDQGSVVFPDATVKFYIDASVDVRAKRRLDEMLAAGRKAELDAIRRNIAERDHKDSTRPDAPLICPPDAQRVDTSAMTFDEVVDLLERAVRTRVGV